MYKLILFVCLSVSALSVVSAPQSYLKEYTYRASEKDSMATSRAHALAAIKAQLLGELGTYIHSDLSMSESTDGSSIAQHNVQAITQGFIKADVVDERWNGFEYYLKARLTADPTVIAHEIKAAKVSIKSDEMIQKKLDESHQAILALRKELSQLKNKINDTSQSNKKEDKQTLAVKNQQLNSYQYLELANNYYLGSNGHSKDVLQAKDYYIKAAQTGNQDAWFFIDYLYQIEIISKPEYQKIDLYRQSNGMQRSKQDSDYRSQSTPGWGEWSH